MCWVGLIFIIGDRKKLSKTKSEDQGTHLLDSLGVKKHSLSVIQPFY